MGYRKARKDPTVAYLGAFFIPGFQYFMTEEVGTGVVIFLITLITMGFGIGFIIWFVLFLSAGGKVKDFNRRNGYPE